MDFHLVDDRNINHLKAQYPGLQDPISGVLFGQNQPQKTMNPNDNLMDVKAQAYQQAMEQLMDQQAKLRQAVSMHADNSVSQANVIKLAIEIEISVKVKNG